MLIKGNYVDLRRREVYPAQLTITDGVIAKIDRVNEVQDRFILPGFIDAHVHIESSMLVPSEFARIAVTHGTVATVSDPHEIANVLGVEGINYMIENAESVPVKFFFGAPSCVPATSFESSGASLEESLIDELLARDDIYYLSEMMNYPGVINRSPEVLNKLALAVKYGKPVDGHAPGLSGDELKKYVKAGISTDHEAFTLEEALDKIKLGMKILIREGSAARNLDALAPLFDIEPEKLMLCSDDIHPEMLVKRHINGLVKELVGRGYNMFDVLKSVSVNPVEHYKIDVGLLMEGDSADFIIVKNLNEFEVLETWINGSLVFADNRVRFSTVKVASPNNFNSSEIKSSDISVKNRRKDVRVIDVEDGELYTKTIITRWSESEYLDAESGEDILKLVVKDRYRDLPASVAFIHGFGIKEGAIASSVAHDSHNIIAIGADNDSIVNAVNAIVTQKGGLAVCSGGKTETLALPVAGIMSDVPCGTIADQYLKLSDRVRNMGSYLKAPFMTLSFMSLLVIPELKLGDKGLFNGIDFCFTELFVE